MINNITPEDRKDWDDRMKAHARRMQKQENGPKAKKVALIVIALIAIGWILLFSWRVWTAPYVPPPTPEQIMADSIEGLPDGKLQQDQGEIRADKRKGDSL